MSLPSPSIIPFPKPEDYASLSQMASWAEFEMQRRAPDVVITSPGAAQDYLRRWWMIPRNELFNVYLHRFLRSDDDRALHDHPWDNTSWLLEGEYLEHTPQGTFLAPLMELKPLYRWMRKPSQRLRKSGVERLKDGSIAKNPQRMGPLTLEARSEALERILDIQRRARVDLINAEEEARIRDLIAARTFPADYIIDRDSSGAPITKTAQVAKCGNSVCPPLAEALVRANMPTPNTAQEAQAA